MIALAEACKTFRLPNELVEQILLLVEELDMYRVHFPRPGESIGLVAEDV